MEKDSVVIFGGSFDPIHQGHILLAEKCIARLAPKKLLLIPSGDSFWKFSAMTADYEARLQMCRIAASSVPQIEVSDIERGRRGVYIADTVRAMKRQYPGQQLVLLMGSDTAATICRWYGLDVIREHCVIAVADRPGGASAAAALKGVGLRWMHIPYEGIRVSSTGLRAAIARGEQPKEMDERVFLYIKENGLYRPARKSGADGKQN